MFFLQKPLYNWLVLENKIVNMLQNPVKLLKKNSSCFFTPATTALLFAICTQVMLVSNGFTPKQTHQIVRFPHCSPPIWWCKSNIFQWCSLSSISLILCFATAAANLFGQNSSTLTFNILSSWVMLVVVFESECNYWIQQLDWSFNNAVPSTYSDWSNCIIIFFLFWRIIW